MMSGPMADARMKTESIIWVSKAVGMENSDWRIGRAGATMLDATGETRRKREVRRVVVHFLDEGQFLGLSRSASQEVAVAVVVGFCSSSRG